MRTPPPLKVLSLLLVLANLGLYVHMGTTGRASFSNMLFLQAVTNLALLRYALRRQPVVIVPPLPERHQLLGDLLGDGEARFGEQQARTALYVLACHMTALVSRNPDAKFQASPDGPDIGDAYSETALKLLMEARRSKREKHRNTNPYRNHDGA